MERLNNIVVNNLQIISVRRYAVLHWSFVIVFSRDHRIRAQSGFQRSRFSPKKSQGNAFLLQSKVIQWLRIRKYVVCNHTPIC